MTHVCFEWATGSGKTLTVLALAAVCLLVRRKAKGQVITHIVCATTQTHIEKAFTDHSFTSFVFPTPEGAASSEYQIPKGFCIAAREGSKQSKRGSKSSGGSKKQLRDYLRLTSPAYMMACTYPTLAIKYLPRTLAGYLLIIDEAHHAPAPGLSAYIDAWKDRGGLVMFFTATAYRSKGEESVLIKDMLIHRRSLAQQMQEGFAPGNFGPEIIPVGRAADRVLSEAQFLGDDDPLDIERVAKSMVQYLKSVSKNGRIPKTIVRVPVQRDGAASLSVMRLKRAFEREGWRVFDASGMGDDKKRAFQELLARERDATYETSEVDIIVGIQRVKEGTDWPLCSHVLVYGMPTALNLVHQLIGRSTRFKGKSHPWANEARIAFFIEVNQDEDVDVISERHAKDALALCILLGSIQSPSMWDFEKNARRVIEEEIADEQRAAEMIVEWEGKVFDLNEQAETVLAVGAALERNPVPPKVQEIVDIATGLFNKPSEQMPDKLAARKATVAKLVYDAAPPERKRKFDRIIQNTLRNSDAIRNGLIDKFPLNEVSMAAVDAVLYEFRDETFTEGPMLKNFQRRIHSYSGATMIKYATRVLHKTPLTEAMIRQWGAAAKDILGRAPKSSDDTEGLPKGETWYQIECALRRGTRGLTGKSSLGILFGYDQGPARKRILAFFDARPGKGFSSREISEALKLPSESVQSHLSVWKSHGFLTDRDGLWYRTRKKNGATSTVTSIDDDKALWKQLRRFKADFTTAVFAERLDREPNGMSAALRALRKRRIIKSVGDSTWRVNRRQLDAYTKKAGI